MSALGAKRFHDSRDGFLDKKANFNDVTSSFAFHP